MITYYNIRNLTQLTYSNANGNTKITNSSIQNLTHIVMFIFKYKRGKIWNGQIPLVNIWNIDNYYQLTMEKKFRLTVPCKEYDIDQYKFIETMDEQLEILVNMYLADINDQDLHDVLHQKSYIRFFLYQDEPDSKAYMYAYSRQISNMTECHKTILSHISHNEILGEINYTTRGYFFSLPKDKVQTKRVTSTDFTPLDW